MGKINYAQILTEKNNPASKKIDQVSIKKVLQIINREDAKVAAAVSKQIPAMEKAVRRMIESLKNGGRIFFLGAGTSGRLGVMEAAECPPTFNTPPSLLQALMAGGRESVFRSKEGAEDKGVEAARIIRRKVKKGDVVIGIAASGVTPFVQEGLKAAKKIGAKTILITGHTRTPHNSADFIISPNTGPEVITGSTRLKAATAAKMILNSLTVTAMVQVGKVYGNWMVDLQPKSQKLKSRAMRLIQHLGNVSSIKAKKLLQESGGNAKTAILMAKKKFSKTQALQILNNCGGHLGMALQKAMGPRFRGDDE